MQGLIQRIRPRFHSNFHSFGEWILYPQGWQTGSPDADNPIYAALAGTDANPAIPGFDPGISSDELYVTNGETTDYADGKTGTIAFTPELGEGVPGSGFVFPDDESLVQAEFEKTLAFDLALARSAVRPADPVSPVGKTTEPFYLDQVEVDPENAPLAMFDFTFDVSYGDPQEARIGGNASRLAMEEMLEVRDYIKEGGRVLYTGKYAGHQFATGHGLQMYDPFENQECRADPAVLARCRALSGAGDAVNDVLEYWFGAALVNEDAGTDPGTGELFPVVGTAPPFSGRSWDFNGRTVPATRTTAPRSSRRAACCRSPSSRSSPAGPPLATTARAGPSSRTPAPNPNDFIRTTAAGFPEGAVVATDDTLYFGFGFEGISDAVTRASVMGSAVEYLLR